MCQFRKTAEENLYSHDVRTKNLFLYTQNSCPDSLADCFSQGDFLLIFCGKGAELSEEYRALAKAASELLAERAPDVCGLLAFAESALSPRSNWTVAQICSNQTDGIAQQDVSSNQADGLALKHACRFPLKGYRFLIPAKTRISVTADEKGAEKLSLQNGKLRYAAEFCCEGAYNARIAVCALLMEGEKAGCFSFELKLTEGLHQIGAGICFSMEKKEPEHGNYVDTLTCLPFYAKTTPLSLAAQLDVTSDDRARSRFLLPAGNYGSFFPVFCDSNLQMKAREGGIALVFAKKRHYRSNVWYTHYLTPEGSMEITSADGSLLTGQSGLEYLSFQKGARLHFHSEGIAYFPADAQGREENGTTAYLSLSAGTYYSQGESDAFFGGVEKKSTVLSYEEIPFRTVGEENRFPMLPMGERELVETAQDVSEQSCFAKTVQVISEQSCFADTMQNNRARHGLAKILAREGAQSFSQKLTELDTMRLAQRRSELMGGADTDVLSEDLLVTAITEKGLLTTFHKGAMSFDMVELADKLRLSNVTGKIRQALLCAQAFLLISDREDFLKYASLVREQEPMAVDGWAFDFDPKLWADNETLILMKYSRGKSIRELAEDPSAWSYPTEEGLAQKNASLLEKLLLDIDGKKELAAFDMLRGIVDDRAWCGTIAFSVPVAGDDLPDDIRFLVKTREAPLLAHHLIFASRTVGEDGSVLPAGTSGVIYYSSPFHPAMDETQEFYYKLDLLLVVMEESQVVDFKCDLSVGFQYFLKSPLYALACSYMLIRGGMTKKKEDAALSAYYFELDSPMEYQADGSAVDTLRIESVSLFASYWEDKIRFLLSGCMKFRQYESDLFSYGDEDSGLYFQDIILCCEAGRFSTDISAMRFLADKSSVRAGSLGEQFPLTWKRFLVVEGESAPEKLGYVTMHCDHIRQEKPEDTYVCAELEIDLGGLGALASAGDLKLSLLAAWTPKASKNCYDGSVDTDAPGLYVGASLGAFSGVSSPIPLQGVMSMSFERIELKKSKGTGEFYLYLRDFSIKLLKYRFPDGNNDIYVFGNASDPKRLGWYGAYEAKGEKDVHKMQRALHRAGGGESDRGV